MSTITTITTINFACSVYDPHSDAFIITGGSDGNDLWRNGTELADVCNTFLFAFAQLSMILMKLLIDIFKKVFVLSVIRSKSERGELSDSFVWSKPNIWGSSLQQMPGRCHW